MPDFPVGDIGFYFHSATYLDSFDPFLILFGKMVTVSTLRPIIRRTHRLRRFQDITPLAVSFSFRQPLIFLLLDPPKIPARIPPIPLHPPSTVPILSKGFPILSLFPPWDLSPCRAAEHATICHSFFLPPSRSALRPSAYLGTSQPLYRSAGSASRFL